MTKSCKVVLELLHKAFDSECDFQIPSDVNWAEVIEVASGQGVLGVCFEAVERLATDQRPDMDNLMDWLGQVEYQKTVWDEHKKAILNLASEYKANGIKMLLMKGYGLSLNYPTPSCRPTGDIDVFLYGKQKEADDYLCKKGIEVNRGSSHHSTFCYGGVTVENHQTLMDQDNHKSNVRLEELFQELIVKDNGVEIGDNIYTPSPPLNAIYLLRHAGEHFASNEITMRHVLDLGTFFQKCGENPDEHPKENPKENTLQFVASGREVLEGSLRSKSKRKSEGQSEPKNQIEWDLALKVYEAESMKSFYDAIATICVRDLGMDASCFHGYAHNEKLADRVLEDIFAKKDVLPISSTGIHGFAKVKYGVQKSMRWWNNRWKYKMVYKESMWESFMGLALNRIKN